jgi:hypothetical protein
MDGNFVRWALNGWQFFERVRLYCAIECNMENEDYE